MTTGRRTAPQGHLEVTLATNPEEELAKDLWDLRRLKSDYPKHIQPGDLRINFSWIGNLALRQQIKLYFRSQLPHWRATTFRTVLHFLKQFLIHLPSDIHLGILTRSHVERILPFLYQMGSTPAHHCLRHVRTMLDHMATSPTWLGPRPQHGLIWPGDAPALADTLPRPVPPDVLDQLDALLEQAVQAMRNGQTPSLLQPLYWDAILILRHTGMRFGDLAHLKAPDIHGRNGCLEQDSEGYWWI